MDCVRTHDFHDRIAGNVPGKRYDHVLVDRQQRSMVQPLALNTI
jgi:hypothetical protein